jgi:hypothetical protein
MSFSVWKIEKRVSPETPVLSTERHAMIIQIIIITLYINNYRPDKVHNVECIWP